MSATPNLDVDYVASTPGAIAWIHPGALTFDDQGELQVIGSKEVFNNPNKQTCTVFELSNDGGNLHLNMSILSNDGLWEILQKNDGKFRSELQSIRSMLEDKIDPQGGGANCGTDGCDNCDDDEGEYSEYSETKYYLYNIEYGFSDLFTKNLVNQLYNVKGNTDNSSNIVDDMLEGIFGKGKVKIEYDPEHDFKDLSDVDTSSLQLIGVDPAKKDEEPDEFEEYNLDTTKEKGGFTIKDLIDDISKNTQNEVKEIEASPLDPNLNILSRHFVDIYKILNINSASESLKMEFGLSKMLDEIFELDFETDLIEVERFLVDTICDAIRQDKDEIACDLLDFNNELQLETSYIEGIVDPNDNSESSEKFKKMYRIKYNLNNDFKSNFAVYTKILDNIMYNRNVLEDSEKIKLFCIIIMLAHLINKNVLKNKRDIDKKKESGFESDTKLDKYESKIVELGDAFLVKFRKEVNNAIG